MASKYRPIGWVVEWRSSLTEEWFAHPLDARKTREEAIRLWTGANSGFGHREIMRKGLARAVRVYLEVR